MAPLGGEDVEVGVGASALPGYGATVSFSQRMLQVEHARLDLEVEVAFQRLGEDPDATDGDWQQVRMGFLGRTDPAGARHWTARAGMALLRAQGDPVYLDAPGDYGGGYVGVGYLVDVGAHVSTGPDLSLFVVDGEGSNRGGLVPQVAWRLVWRL